ncbi:putative ABC-type xenobiotic transporter [Helianthus annuus]|nr:putative ABC-type xenobiotic transporter [Helianthus annuus]
MGRMEFVGSLFLCVSTVFMILLPSNVIKPEDVGLSLSYRLSLNGLLFWVLYTSCFVENRMVSVERIKQFTNIPSKAEWVKKDKSPPPNWPTHGSLELRNLQIDLCKLWTKSILVQPQELVLFEGTVRSNIDPIGQHSDDEIWKDGPIFYQL